MSGPSPSEPAVARNSTRRHYADDSAHREWNFLRGVGPSSSEVRHAQVASHAAGAGDLRRGQEHPSTPDVTARSNQGLVTCNIERAAPKWGSNTLRQASDKCQAPDITCMIHAHADVLP